MGYIITAEIDTTCEENGSGDIKKVKARTLSRRDGYITFDIKGTFGEQRELTKKLCDDIIDAGFVSFSIGHSY